ncbi:MAG: membrane protein insertase YidC, partial [Candidatus Adiutrix sp.]
MDTRFFWIMAVMLLVLMGWSFYMESTPQPVRNTVASAPSAPSAPVALIDDSVEHAPLIAMRDTITVTTPLYVAVFSERGGRLNSFTLLNYNKRKLDSSNPDAPMELLTMPKRSSWPMRLSFTDPTMPSLEEAPFIANQESLTLKAGQTGQLVMTFTAPSGLVVRRTLTFSADSYLTLQEVTMENHGPNTYNGILTMRLNSAPFSAKPGRYDEMAAFINNKLVTASASDAPSKLAGFRGKIESLDWVGYMDQYFLTALVMPKAESGETVQPAINAVLQDHGGVAVGVSRSVELPPNRMTTIDFNFYYGPKSNAALALAGHNLSQSVDLGWFAFLAKPLASLLRWMYSWCGNYGLAIIFVTVLIKIALWPLVIKSYRSMKEMQTLQPKVIKLRERYGNDKEAMNREIMQLYRTFKVNPLGGCLPMLLQIPFF